MCGYWVLVEVKGKYRICSQTKWDKCLYKLMVFFHTNINNLIILCFYCMIAALENEVLRNSKPLFDQPFLSPDKLVSPFAHTSVDRDPLRVRAHFVNIGEEDGPVQESPALRSDLLDYNMDSVAEAKARLQELQEGAETLEDAYRAYQQRAVHSTIPLTFSTRPCPSMAHRLHRTIDKNFPEARLLHKTKPAETPEPPQPAAALSSQPYDTMYTVQTGQPTVTSVELNKLHSTVFNDYSAHVSRKPPQQSVPHPQEGSISPSRQSSHKLRFDSRVNLQRNLSEGTV